jgi:hypothetical protein
MAISLRYPAGSVTKHGAYYLCQGQVPTMKLRSYDDTAVFTLIGGEALPNRYEAPECVVVKDMKGLIPPWKQIDQKGATEDGRTFVTSLYDPCEIDITAVVRGKTPASTRKTYRDLVASIDAIETAELSWFTHQLGRWWAPVRWLSPPADPMGGIETRRQVANLRLRGYNAFWRSYDIVDQFRLSYMQQPESFSTDYSSGLGSGWTVQLAGAGSGGLSVSNGQVVPTLANGKTAIARRVGFTGSTPIVELQIGSLSNWYWDSTTALDFWAMSGTGTPGDNGIRVRITNNTVTTTSFSAGVGTLLNTQLLQLPPKSAESWTAVFGPTVKLMRSGALAYSYKPATAPTFTSAGFGLYAAGTAVAPGVKTVSFGTDATATQSGFVSLVNWGDQPMPPRFTCIGPGTFYMGNGPGAGPNDMVKFGPLASNQLAQVITDSRKRGVVDLSMTPTSTDEQNIFNAGLQDIFGFSNLLTGLIQGLTGLFGSGSTPLPPQGNLYSLLQGRFSKAAYIPPKPVGRPPKRYSIPVKIEGGNSSSQILAAGTPLRRLPY